MLCWTKSHNVIALARYINLLLKCIQLLQNSRQQCPVCSVNRLRSRVFSAAGMGKKVYHLRTQKHMHCTDAVVPSYSTKKQRLSQLRKVIFFFFFANASFLPVVLKTHFKKSLLVQQGRLILLKPRFINCYFPCKMAIFSFIIIRLDWYGSSSKTFCSK